MSDNPLAPPAPPGLPPHITAASQVVKQHSDMVGAQSAKMNEGLSNLQKVAEELDKLTRLGDAITPDEVIQAASRLVGHGGDPAALAGLLADMPENGGAALQGWVASHDQNVKAQLGQAMAQAQAAQHQAAVAGLHALMADHMATAGVGNPPAAPGQALAKPMPSPYPSPSGNPLAGGLTPTSPTLGSA